MAVNVILLFVVMHANSNNEVLTSVSHKMKGAGCSTAIHGEHLLSIQLIPSFTIGIVPNGFLYDVEVGIGVGLVDAEGDFVAHSAWKRRARCCLTALSCGMASNDVVGNWL